MKDKLLYIITLPITLYIVFKLKRDRKKRLTLSAYGKEILRKFEEKGTSLDIELVSKDLTKLELLEKHRR